jgi:hypothetical protein
MTLTIAMNQWQPFKVKTDTSNKSIKRSSLLGFYTIVVQANTGSSVL